MTVSRIKTAKYRLLQEWIVADVAAGVYSAGEKLPSCREMAKNFNVSYLTVISAMRGLEERGCVRRVAGSGIYVLDPDAKSEVAAVAANATVGALMPLTGDLFQNFADSFVDVLESRDYQLVPLPTKGVFGLQSFERQERIIAGLAERGLDALVIEGTRHVPYRLLEKYKSEFKRLTFAIHNESEIDFPEANSVTCDYLRVGELAAEHLLKAGSAKLAMLTFEPLSEMERRSNGSRRVSHDSRVIDGIESAFNAAGADFATCFTLIVDESGRNTERSTVLKVSNAMRNGFDGFFCLADHRAQTVYKAAAEQGLEVGRDIKIVGMYDTKWAELLFPPLSSISVNERKIAKIAAELIASRSNGERVVVEPSFIQRSSTAEPCR
ncbi:MAG: substrate-binding domain-containing protein [Kiritimatiellaeota bacterium]|nr:substrate-binding domain-containing protein [Kiritimatiellota bacterium]